MMIKAGLTGSIGMGKTTTANMFRDEGIPVYDADAEVHALYKGEAVARIEQAFPGTEKNGKIDRTELARQVLGNPDAMKKLEAIVHPLVHKKEKQFLDEAKKQGHALVILDIPLLFETKGENRVEMVIVVTASPEEQRRRVLARTEMTEEKFESILQRQIPDTEKRKRADIIIDTGKGIEAVRRQVKQIIASLQSAKI